MTMAVVHKDVYKALVDAGVPKNTAETIASADRAEREVSKEATQVLIVQYHVRSTRSSTA